jgi:pantetheine-phosphate adenylyltransferase
MTTKAVYAGTFDPITLGHEDITRRAAKLFDTIIIAIATSQSKKPLFTLEERIAIAREAFADTPNVEVMGFTGILMNFVRQQGARVVVRGVRSVTDFDYEFQLAGMNRNLYPEVETIFLTPGEKHAYVSATLVREISMLGGDASQFVSPRVAEKLAAKAKAR